MWGKEVNLTECNVAKAAAVYQEMALHRCRKLIPCQCAVIHGVYCIQNVPCCMCCVAVGQRFWWWVP